LREELREFREQERDRPQERDGVIKTPSRTVRKR